ncbi:hypothetical protein M409DRAFT_16624 [Zasmidium cellare ATCC 36951]|uniref:Aflatoxin regulatory protein domain-containing protein n=1 Tax=Zasmidium cellare ATCC 36951 TaxID=1080233 RepID=A0A6A6D3A1_ZASCE|nr:uncharacterized protein M409DRAFT_16624 [Zasmidium cellare ATCC 36951]KAF2172662.1 hypothetical protein M409DRAFT_16624 [Zasmidium cellare ATCC 36951]
MSLIDDDLSSYVDIWPNATAWDYGTTPPSFSSFVLPDCLLSPAPVKDIKAETTQDHMPERNEGEPNCQTSAQQVAPVAKMLATDDTDTREAPKHVSCLQKLLDAALALKIKEPKPADSWGKASSDEPAESIDQVLLRNRAIIKLLNSVLDCNCACLPDIILACYMTLTKVVACYEDALDSSCFATASAASSIHNLSRQAQSAVLARVILSELQDQVKPLLKRLPQRTICASTSEESEGCALRNSIRGIVLKVDRTLRT